MDHNSIYSYDSYSTCRANPLYDITNLQWVRLPGGKARAQLHTTDIKPAWNNQFLWNRGAKLLSIWNVGSIYPTKRCQGSLSSTPLRYITWQSCSKKNMCGHGKTTQYTQLSLSHLIRRPDQEFRTKSKSARSLWQLSHTRTAAMLGWVKLGM